MNNAIVCLSRGHLIRQGYNELITRNVLISQYIGNTYPLIIFNEGNISLDDQKYIKSYTTSLNIFFEDISAVWNKKYPYPSMCRFFAYHIWDYCKHYDNILRIDTDCHLFKCLNDPFSLLQENVFLKSSDSDEDHTLTNTTLPSFISSLVGMDSSHFYTHRFPYTNVCLSNVNFWKEKEVSRILRAICLTPRALTNRWGDLPILGSLLNIYAKNKVGTLTGLSYYHGSHQTTVIC